MEGFQWGGGRGEGGEKVWGIRSIIGRQINGERSKMYRKQRTQITYMSTHGQELMGGEGILEG